MFRQGGTPGIGRNNTTINASSYSEQVKCERFVNIDSRATSGRPSNDIHAFAVPD
jgi:hypothetical protein